MLKEVCIKLLSRKYPTVWENNLNDSDPLQRGEFLNHHMKQKAKTYRKDMATSEATYYKGLIILVVGINESLRDRNKEALANNLADLNKLTLSWISKL